MCHTGVRGQVAVKWLKSKGCEHAVNVLGGIDAWSALIDNSFTCCNPPDALSAFAGEPYLYG